MNFIENEILIKIRQMLELNQELKFKYWRTIHKFLFNNWIFIRELNNIIKLRNAYKFCAFFKFMVLLRRFFPLYCITPVVQYFNVKKPFIVYILQCFTISPLPVHRFKTKCITFTFKNSIHYGKLGILLLYYKNRFLPVLFV